MDARTLARAMECPIARAEEMCAPMNAAMIAADCTTLNRAAMWCAQIGHESAGLVYMEEIADGQRYNGRADLGNTQPGDGPRYKGSGPIQLTGRNNFRRFSEWCHSLGLVPTPRYFEDNPQLVRDDPRWGFLAASWYWTIERPRINAMCDRQDIEGVTRAINGGLTHIDDRIRRYRLCREIGAALLPEEEFLMSLNPVEQKTVWSGAAQLNGASGSVRKAPAWLAKFLPKSFRDEDGPWVRDQIDAITNETVTGVFTFSPDDTIDFGDGPVRLVDVPASQPVNFVTLQRIIAARLVHAQQPLVINQAAPKGK
ncbi:lysin A, glycosyl hydrolase domain [Gordonia phage RavenCo17]|nr:lysin A, glycosyl hydrolase domain [Gordonia phage RavenCo17]